MLQKKNKKATDTQILKQISVSVANYFTKIIPPN